MEIVKEEDRVVGFKGILEGANENFQFNIEMVD